ncbi:hypothetical protein BY458DRAFT_566214 [Sporodiniella umbellata]|nr:hypothetical protein BY458DRAFT_566214 [Sporodiniella umbellata]
MTGTEKTDAEAAQAIVASSQKPRKRKTYRRKSTTKVVVKKTDTRKQETKEIPQEPSVDQKESTKNPTIVKKRSRKRNRKTAVERHDTAEDKIANTPNAVVKSQSVKVFDYQELEKELNGHAIPDISAPIYFAPEKKTREVRVRNDYSETKAREPKTKSGSKEKHTAGRYSAVPPPISLVAKHEAKSRKTPKKSKGEGIPKIEKKSGKKEARKGTEDEFKISAPSVKLPSKKNKTSTLQQKPTSNEPLAASGKTPKKKSKENDKVKVLDQVDKHIATPTKQNKTKSVNKDVQKEALTKEYCHPYDILYGQKNPRFDKYMDPKVCEQQIKEKDSKMYKGVLRISKRNHSDAYFTSDQIDTDIYIFGSRDRNRALEGDIVYVQLTELDSVWERKKESMAQKNKDRNIESDPNDEKLKPKYVGKVVAIANTRKDHLYSGIITLSRESLYTVNKANDSQLEEEEIETETETEIDSQALNKDGTEGKTSASTTKAKQKRKRPHCAWFRPIDKRAPIIGVPMSLAPPDIIQNEEKYLKRIVVVQIQNWAINVDTPRGAFVRELGQIGNIPAETEAVLSDNNISEEPFTKKALKNLPPTPWSIDQSQIDNRRDLRETRIFTIDPATAKDLDDAVHVTKIADNDFEVGVHIADVSHFLKPHTNLDHEAYDRGTSTYLCDRVIPMLPSLLCEELCSLNPGVDRLAFSVIWKMDKEGNIKDTWFGKTVIRSCTKLAYEDAQCVIEGQKLPEHVNVTNHEKSSVEQDILYLFEMSKSMRKRRFENGALSINSIKLSFKLNELGEPCEVSVYEQKDSNRLIEEFMLRANMSVAAKIYEHYPNEALLRQHSPPHEKSLNEFLRIAEKLGYSLDGSSAGNLQKSFNAIDSDAVKEVLRLLAVKPMQRAKYFCTGACDEEQFRHYALNVPLYTHFTSPIRRFPDIIVHRQLQAALQGKKNCGYTQHAIQKASVHTNEKKEGAKNSQDANLKLYLYHYLHNLEKDLGKPIICTAIVTQVVKDSFDVLVPEYGIEKRVYLDSMPIVKHVYNTNKNSQSVYWGKSTDKVLKNSIENRGRAETVDMKVHLENNTGGVCDVPEELNENALDIENRVQIFDTFSKLEVRIQVNIDVSPPSVSIHPVNPFI